MNAEFLQCLIAAGVFPPDIDDVGSLAITLQQNPLGGLLLVLLLALCIVGLWLISSLNRKKD